MDNDEQPKTTQKMDNDEQLLTTQKTHNAQRPTILTTQKVAQRPTTATEDTHPTTTETQKMHNYKKKIADNTGHAQQPTAERATKKFVTSLLL